jgi:hypothetical protein
VCVIGFIRLSMPLGIYYDSQPFIRLESQGRKKSQIEDGR